MQLVILNHAQFQQLQISYDQLKKVTADHNAYNQGQNQILTTIELVIDQVKRYAIDLTLEDVQADASQLGEKIKELPRHFPSILAEFKDDVTLNSVLIDLMSITSLLPIAYANVKLFIAQQEVKSIEETLTDSPGIEDKPHIFLGANSDVYAADERNQLVDCARQLAQFRSIDDSRLCTLDANINSILERLYRLQQHAQRIFLKKRGLNVTNHEIKNNLIFILEQHDLLKTGLLSVYSQVGTLPDLKAYSALSLTINSVVSEIIYKIKLSLLEDHKVWVSQKSLQFNVNDPLFDIKNNVLRNWLFNQKQHKRFAISPNDVVFYNTFDNSVYDDDLQQLITQRLQKWELEIDDKLLKMIIDEQIRLYHGLTLFKNPVIKELFQDHPEIHVPVASNKIPTAETLAAISLLNQNSESEIEQYAEILSQVILGGFFDETYRQTDPQASLNYQESLHKILSFDQRQRSAQKELGESMLLYRSIEKDIIRIQRNLNRIQKITVPNFSWLSRPVLLIKKLLLNRAKMKLERIRLRLPKVNHDFFDYALLAKQKSIYKQINKLWNWTVNFSLSNHNVALNTFQPPQHEGITITSSHSMNQHRYEVAHNIEHKNLAESKPSYVSPNRLNLNRGERKKLDPNLWEDELNWVKNRLQFLVVNQTLLKDTMSIYISGNDHLLINAARDFIPSLQKTTPNPIAVYLKGPGTLNDFDDGHERYQKIFDAKKATSSELSKTSPPLQKSKQTLVH